MPWASSWPSASTIGSTAMPGSGKPPWTRCRKSWRGCAGPPRSWPARSQGTPRALVDASGFGRHLGLWSTPRVLADVSGFWSMGGEPMEREPTATFDPAWIDDALQLLQRSPLRRPSHPSRSMPAPFAQEVVEDIPRRVRALKERLFKPLTLAVLGEVKAGKSTLVNALVGADVAPVDVLEATQWIMEIRAADEPYGKVLFADGSTHGGTTQELP